LVGLTEFVARWVFYSSNDPVTSIGFNLQITRTLHNVRDAIRPQKDKPQTPIQQERLPGSSADLWEWLGEQDDATLLSLLAFCLGLLVSPTDTLTLKRLGEVCGLDLTQWWTPTVDNYLGRVRSKEQILEAVREGAGIEAERQVAKLKKKPDMAKRAEELLRGKGWLPRLFKE
jgi:hypothetical protein